MMMMMMMMMLSERRSVVMGNPQSAPSPDSSVPVVRIRKKLDECIKNRKAINEQVMNTVCICTASFSSISLYLLSACCPIIITKTAAKRVFYIVHYSFVLC